MGNADYFGQVACESVQIHPVGVLVVARSIGATSSLFGDLTHDESEQKIVVGIEKRPSHRLRQCGTPACLVEEFLEHLVHVPSELRVLFRGYILSFRIGFAQSYREESGYHAFEFLPMILHEPNHLSLMVPTMHGGGEHYSRIVLKGEGKGAADVKNVHVKSPGSQVVGDSTSDALRVSLASCV